MPQYRAGGWDGTVSLFNKLSRTIPYGLLFDLLKHHKKLRAQGAELPQIQIDPEVKALFKGPKVEIVDTLTLKPYDYQLDCIEAALSHTKGIIRSATASGKSLMIAYILETLNNHDTKNRSIIIVPTKGLINQFVEDLTDYGIDRAKIGTVFAGSKQFHKKIVVSTWQTLARNHNKLKLYNTIIVDEVHGVKSHELKKIVSKAKEAQYRLGFTGTMHSGELDNLNVKSFLGPVLRDYSAGKLAEMGHIAECTVNVINIIYRDNEERFQGEYNDVKEQLFNNGYRLNALTNLVQCLDDTVLLLVGKVEKEGAVLRDYFREQNLDKEVVFLSGKTSTDEEREFWRKEASKRKDLIVIATYGIFQLGINIPPLKYLILVSPFKSKIRVLQSIGRALRKHAEKVHGAQIFDIVDTTKYFEDHGIRRLRHYYTEQFTVREFILNEGDEADVSQVICQYPQT
jgi:superfamily II DNA or RNA helicase